MAQAAATALRPLDELLAMPDVTEHLTPEPLAPRTRRDGNIRAIGR